jgi:hypothetical protein
MPHEDSLFYLVATESGQSMINKKMIESARHIGEDEVEIIMKSGDKFIAFCKFGDLMFHLFHVQHTNDTAA